MANTARKSNLADTGFRRSPMDQTYIKLLVSMVEYQAKACEAFDQRYLRLSRERQKQAAACGLTLAQWERELARPAITSQAQRG